MDPLQDVPLFLFPPSPSAADSKDERAVAPPRCWSLPAVVGRFAFLCLARAGSAVLFRARRFSLGSNATRFEGFSSSPAPFHAGVFPQTQVKRTSSPLTVFDIAAHVHRCEGDVYQIRPLAAMAATRMRRGTVKGLEMTWIIVASSTVLGQSETKDFSLEFDAWMSAPSVDGSCRAISDWLRTEEPELMLTDTLVGPGVASAIILEAHQAWQQWQEEEGEQMQLEEEAEKEEAIGPGTQGQEDSLAGRGEGGNLYEEGGAGRIMLPSLELFRPPSPGNSCGVDTTHSWPVYERCCMNSVSSASGKSGWRSAMGRHEDNDAAACQAPLHCSSSSSSGDACAPLKRAGSEGTSHPFRQEPSRRGGSDSTPRVGDVCSTSNESSFQRRTLNRGTLSSTSRGESGCEGHPGQERNHGDAGDSLAAVGIEPKGSSSRGRESSGTFEAACEEAVMGFFPGCTRGHALAQGGSDASAASAARGHAWHSQRAGERDAMVLPAGETDACAGDPLGWDGQLNAQGPDSECISDGLLSNYPSQQKWQDTQGHRPGSASQPRSTGRMRESNEELLKSHGVVVSPRLPRRSRSRSKSSGSVLGDMRVRQLRHLVAEQTLAELVVEEKHVISSSLSSEEDGKRRLPANLLDSGTDSPRGGVSMAETLQFSAAGRAGNAERVVSGAGASAGRGERGDGGIERAKSDGAERSQRRGKVQGHAWTAEATATSSARRRQGGGSASSANSGSTSFSHSQRRSRGIQALISPRTSVARAPSVGFLILTKVEEGEEDRQERQENDGNCEDDAPSPAFGDLCRCSSFHGRDKVDLFGPPSARGDRREKNPWRDAEDGVCGSVEGEMEAQPAQEVQSPGNGSLVHKEKSRRVSNKSLLRDRPTRRVSRSACASSSTSQEDLVGQVIPRSESGVNRLCLSVDIQDVVCDAGAMESQLPLSA